MQTVRRANPADAAAIAALHVRSWQSVYRGLMPDAFLDRLDKGQREQVWRRTLLDAAADVFVVDDIEGRVVGLCSLVPSRDGDADSRTAQIPAIHVEPGRRRTGVGAVLVAAALERARSRGFSTLTLWVIEGNEGACRFYEALGFQRDGTQKVESRYGDFSVREHRFRIAVATRESLTGSRGS